MSPVGGRTVQSYRQDGTDGQPHRGLSCLRRRGGDARMTVGRLACMCAFPCQFDLFYTARVNGSLLPPTGRLRHATWWPGDTSSSGGSVTAHSAVA